MECEESFSTKSLFQYGQEVNIQEQVTEAQQHVVQEVISKGNSLFSDDARSLNGILVAGGSAEAIYARAKDVWQHSILVKNPRWAVADGFARYALGQIIRSIVNANAKRVSAVNG